MTRRAELDGLATSIAAAAVALGMTTPKRAERWHVDEGSKTYGRAYRLYQLGADEVDTARHAILTADERARDPYPYGSGHYSAAGLNDYLGMTHRDAVASLRRVLDTLWAVQRGQEGKR